MIGLFSLLVVLFPFLHQFGLPIEIPFITEHFSIGMLVLLPFLACSLLNKVPVEGVFGMKPVRLGGFFVFSVISIALSLVGSGFSGGGRAGSVDAAIVLGFGLLLLFGSRGWFNIADSMRTYSFFATLAALWLIAQYLLLRFRGVMLTDLFSLSGKLVPFSEAGVQSFAETGIPASVFLSPDSLALWLLPALAYLLLWNRSGYAVLPFVSSALMTGAIFLSGSVIGILLCAIPWLVYIAVPVAYFLVHPADAVHRFANGGAGRVCLQILAYLVFVILITLYLLDGTLLRVVVPRLRELLSSPVLSCGIEYASELLTRTRLQMCGVGIGNVEAALLALGHEGVELNTLGTVLLSTGLIGLAAFLFMMISLIVKRRGKFGFTVAAMLFFVALLADVAYAPILGFWFLIAHYADSHEMPMKAYMRL